MAKSVVIPKRSLSKGRAAPARAKAKPDGRSAPPAPRAVKSAAPAAKAKKPATAATKRRGPEPAEVGEAARALGLVLGAAESKAVSLALGGTSTLLTSAPRAGDLALFATAASIAKRPVLVASPLSSELYAAARALGKLDVIGFGSFVKAGSRAAAKGRLSRGGSLLVVVDPAQLLEADLRSAVSKSPLSLLGVAAAHAASPDAHELCPAYLDLRQALAAFGAPVLAACTRAPFEVVMAAAEALGVGEGNVVPRIAPALTERAQVVWGRERRAALFEELGRVSGPGIVLTATVQEADAVYAELTQRGHGCERLHAGMAPAERAQALSRFTAASARSILVTLSPHSAPSGLAGPPDTDLGLGSLPPRADLAFLIHYQAPLSLEQHFEDTAWLPPGANAALFADSSDATLVQALLAQQRVKPAAIDAVARALAAGPPERPMTTEALALRSGTSRRALERIMSALAERGAITREGNNVQVRDSAEAMLDQARLLSGAFATLKSRDPERASAFAADVTSRHEFVTRSNASPRSAARA